MNINDPQFQRLCQRTEELNGLLKNHVLSGSALLDEALSKYQAKQQLESKANDIKKAIKKANSILQMEELKSRKAVLRQLSFITTNDIIETKGRVACEISTGDELLLTELIFAGTFNGLSCEQIAALLSCFVCEEKADEAVKLRDDLINPLKLLQDTALRIVKASTLCKMPSFSEEDYLQKFRPELMDIVYAWCRGTRFGKICSMTNVFEGNIIRCLRRLEELIRQMAQAARSIGNSELETKFQDAGTKLKRDIVFANSLYL